MLCASFLNQQVQLVLFYTEYVHGFISEIMKEKQDFYLITPWNIYGSLLSLFNLLYWLAMAWIAS